MSYEDSLSSLTPSERKYFRLERALPVFSSGETVETWLCDLPPADTMDDPSACPVNTERAFTMPWVELAEIESLMYDRGDPYNGRPWPGTMRHFNRIDTPLALLDRFEKEVFTVRRQAIHGLPSSPEEMIRRRWEQVLSSRLPKIEKPSLPGPEDPYDDYGDPYYEELFLARLLPSLELLGGSNGHPSQGIRMPRILTESTDWQEYIKKQAHFYAQALETRNSWLPFLLTRPFVVFQVISDAERLRRGYTKAMVLNVWKERGYWIGARWSEDRDGPGWTWPCEDPVYFLDDHVGSWSLVDLWPGDPKKSKGMHESPRPKSVTEEELENDPLLSHRPQDWSRQLLRQKRREARQEAAAASAIDVKNWVAPPPWVELNYKFGIGRKGTVGGKKPVRVGDNAAQAQKGHGENEKGNENKEDDKEEGAGPEERKKKTTLTKSKVQKTIATSKTHRGKPVKGRVAAKPRPANKAAKDKTSRRAPVASGQHSDEQRRSSRLAGLPADENLFI